MRDINDDPENTERVTLSECIGVASNACQQETADGQSTRDMTNCAQRETAWWDQQLNFYYSELKENLEQEKFAKLRVAQRAWIAYRDASCDFEYELWKEGSIRNVIYTDCILQRTAVQAIELSETLSQFGQ